MCVDFVRSSLCYAVFKWQPSSIGHNSCSKSMQNYQYNSGSHAIMQTMIILSSVRTSPNFLWPANGHTLDTLDISECFSSGHFSFLQHCSALVQVNVRSPSRMLAWWVPFSGFCLSQSGCEYLWNWWNIFVNLFLMQFSFAKIHLILPRMISPGTSSTLATGFTRRSTTIKTIWSFHIQCKHITLPFCLVCCGHILPFVCQKFALYKLNLFFCIKIL